MTTQNQPTRNPKLSYVYQELTKNDNGDYNLVNMVAYILYKERKIEYFTNKGGNPTEEEIQQFHAIYILPGALDSFRAQAEIIVSDLLNTSLTSKINEVSARFAVSTEARMASSLDALSLKIDTNQSTTNTAFSTATQLATTNSATINTKLNSMTEQGGKWWLFEIGKSALVTVASTFLLWLIFVAIYQGKVMYDKNVDGRVDDIAKNGAVTQPASEPTASK